MQRSSTTGIAATKLRELVYPNGGSEHVADVSESYAWCKRVAAAQYENFPVGSFIVPAQLRRHFFSVYAFSRFGDDLGDEPWTNDPDERLDALNFLDRALDDPQRTDGHPIFLALHQTIVECHLPLEPFHRLIEAFRRDVRGFVPSSWSDILDYCSYSANPVGELVLRLDSTPSEEMLKASDAICTALQVTNFLQDLSRDRSIGRNYLPLPLAEVVSRTSALYNDGLAVLDAVQSRRLRWELRMIIAGGITVLNRCSAMIDLLPYQRPVLRKSDYLRIAVRAALLRSTAVDLAT